MQAQTVPPWEPTKFWGYPQNDTSSKHWKYALGVVRARRESVVSFLNGDLTADVRGRRSCGTLQRRAA